MKIALITTLPELIENKRIEEEVKNFGHEFQLVDLSDFNFLISNSSLVLKKITDLKTDMVIVRGIFISLKAICTLIYDLREKGIKVFDNNFLNHKYSISKTTDMIKLSLAKIPVPDTAFTRNIDDYYTLSEKIGFPLIIKSSRMGKGANIFKINNKEELERMIKDIELEDKKAQNYLLQEFIPYVHDLRVLIIGDNIFTMKRIPKEGDFRANFSRGGSVELFDLDEEGKKLALDALHVVNMTVGGVDILIDKDDNRYVLEVNHIAGFVGMEKATDKNIGKLFVEHTIKEAK